MKHMLSPTPLLPGPTAAAGGGGGVTSRHGNTTRVLLGSIVGKAWKGASTRVKESGTTVNNILLWLARGDLNALVELGNRLQMDRV